MPSIITLNGIDEALSNLPYRNPNALKSKLINAIRSYYLDELSVENLRKIDVDQLVRRLWINESDEKVIKNKRRNLSSLRSSINAELERLYKEGKNPEGVTIGPAYTFEMSNEAKDKILNRFAYQPDENSPFNMSQIMDVLSVVHDILEKPDGLSDEEEDNESKLEKIKELIKNISDRVGLKGEKELVYVEKDNNKDKLDTGLENTTENDGGTGDEEGGIGNGPDDRGEIENSEDPSEPPETEYEPISDDIAELEAISEDEEFDESEIIDTEEIEGEAEEIDEEEFEESEYEEFLEEEDDFLSEEDDEFNEFIEADEVKENLEDEFEEDELVELAEDEELEEAEEEDLEAVDIVDEAEDETEEIINYEEELEEVDADEEIEGEDELFELVEDEELEETEEDDLEEVDVIEDDEDELDEELNEAKKLAKQFDEYLAEMDRVYNQYVPVPKGTYIIGGKKPKRVELLAKKVSIESFVIGKFPVTNALFEVFVEKTGYKTTAEKIGYGMVCDGRYQSVVDEETGLKTVNWNSVLTNKVIEGACWYQPLGPGSNLHKKRNHPVVQVSWEDAMAFAEWTGKRLPSEKEWEAAARTRKGNPFPWGNRWKRDSCNIDESYIGGTTPVDHYINQANGLGLVDMLGNVMEWTMDKVEDMNNQKGKNSYYVAKGGSFISGKNTRLSVRFILESTSHSNVLGFRCIAL